MQYISPTNKRNYTTELSLVNFPLFLVNDPYYIVQGLVQYFCQWFSKWPSTHDCTWILPSINQMSSYFLCHQFDIVDALEQLEERGFQVILYDYDNRVILFREASFKNGKKGWLFQREAASAKKVSVPL